MKSELAKRAAEIVRDIARCAAAESAAKNTLDMLTELTAAGQSTPEIEELKRTLSENSKFIEKLQLELAGIMTDE